MGEVGVEGYASHSLVLNGADVVGLGTKVAVVAAAAARTLAMAGSGEQHGISDP